MEIKSARAAIVRVFTLGALLAPGAQAQAQKQGWTVITMKNDWKRIFSFEQ